MLLAGDVGGTNTRLAVFSKDKGPRVPLAREKYPSAEYSGLEAIVKRFLAACGLRVESACFGVAGPVKDGRASVTNLPWMIDEKTLALELELTRVTLLNDLEAIACAIPHLKEGDLEIINRGEAEANGTIALIAPGTGLGEAFLTWDKGKYTAHPSEGGHASFAPSSELESELLQFMRRHYQHVSFERVCSGIGIPNIYRFLKETGRFEEPDWLGEQIRGAKDPSPVIFKHALATPTQSAICVAVLDLFIAVLGSEAGNLALKVLSTAGVYLGGGIPPRITQNLKQGGFMPAFTNKGRLSSLLSPMPVNIIMNPDVALIGAASKGIEIV